MKKSFALLVTTTLACLGTTSLFAQNIATNAPSGKGATTIYRQVMPDGRIMYSDTVTKGVKIDRVLSFPDTSNQAASGPAEGSSLRGAGNPGKTESSGRTAK
jgi:hypothetical protein